MIMTASTTAGAPQAGASTVTEDHTTAFTTGKITTEDCTDENTTSVNGHAANGEYQYPNQYLGQKRRIRIIVVGAGLSGIAAVKIYKENFPERDVEMVIYEKNADVTGTWLENRYPGCACDVPAHAYTFSWEGNPNWSRAYVGSVELYEYFKGRAGAYGVDEFVRLGHRVTAAAWDDRRGKWVVSLDDTRDGRRLEDEADILVNAAGFLNNWKWPDIPGLDSFQGKLLHSAAWDNEYDFSDKIVAVIGCGSSAIQIVPQLQPKTKHLYSINRSKTWITPEFAAEFAPEGRTSFFSDEQKTKWANDKDEFLRYRKEVNSTVNSFFEMQFKSSTEQKMARENFRKTMKERLRHREDLIEKIVPDFEVGCRRITPGHGYLEALASQNVTVRNDGIIGVTSEGLRMATGDTIKIDALVCATGFDTSYRPSFPVKGYGGQDLRDLWREQPRSYLSVAAAGIPNYFITSGPNFPLANGCLLPALENNIRYAFAVAQKLQYDGIKSVSPKTAAVDDFQEYKESLMKDLVWTGSCTSW
ncbi:hypothetical protein PV10_00355 [Exophiala mesophila]|uniref:FAD/NAD(P)-binding domain-containing protein n=1 Tax=Exophiala mesophila TaxID=212818 RepID=A0A0D2AC54_EXOME|nr:uncharacterized protein PV10_00355 [Exophiala mesophila]KIV96493.1 hypothetical protein PV10_00355 [Exophiala mesophila]